MVLLFLSGGVGMSDPNPAYVSKEAEQADVDKFYREQRAKERRAEHFEMLEIYCDLSVNLTFSAANNMPQEILDFKWKAVEAVRNKILDKMEHES
jgi:hypothetical protein